MTVNEMDMERLHCGSTEEIVNYLTGKGLGPTHPEWSDAVNKMHGQKIKNKGELVDYLLEKGLQKGSKEMDQMFAKYSVNLPLR